GRFADIFPSFAIEADDAAGPFRDDTIALPFGRTLGEALIADGEVLRAVIEGDLAGEPARQLDRLEDARGDAPAGDARALEDFDIMPATDEGMGRRKAGDAGADDADPHDGPA